MSIEELNQLGRLLLEYIGENPNREGLLKTPERFSKMLFEITAGYRDSLNDLVNGAIFEVDNSDLVIVKDIEFFSLCEHHLLPFFGRACVAYLPDQKILGLSKIPRLIQHCASKLQVQENLTREILDMFVSILEPKGFIVVMQGQHLCSMMRGAKSVSSKLVTISSFGSLDNDRDLRNELLRMVGE